MQEIPRVAETRVVEERTREMFTKYALLRELGRLRA